MTDYVAAGRNLGLQALRRLASAYKPFVRRTRQQARKREQRAFADDARAVEREVATIARGRGRIVAGPWLAEVGYEALYWVPFLRWFQDAHRVDPERIIVVSRGGVGEWYRELARTYVDIFDHLDVNELASRNAARMASEEGGGRKQSAPGGLDQQVLDAVGAMSGDAVILHPSLMFRLFRHVWHGNLALDFLWTHTDYRMMQRPPRPAVPDLPRDYIAAKFYTGTALPDEPEHRAAVRSLVRQAASLAPVVVLDTGLTVDDHRDCVFDGLANVISARAWMEPRSNLGVQSALAANARLFLGTCGGLAWLAPFFGVPTVAVYADDRQLAPHLLVARHAGRRLRTAELMLVDLRARAYLSAPAHSAEALPAAGRVIS